MMNNIKNLVSVYLKQMLHRFGKMFQKKGRAKTSPFRIAAFLIIIFGYLFYTMYNMFYIYGELLSAQNLQINVILLGLVYSNLILLFLFVFEVQGYFFKQKDEELLASMPIKPYEIVISKFASILLFAYIYQSLFYVPALVVAGVFGALQATSIFMLTVGFFFVPIFLLFLAAIIGILVNTITNMVNGNKSMKLVLMFVFLFGLMFAFSFVNSALTDSILQSNQAPVFLYAVLPTNMILFEAVLHTSWLWFGVYLLLNGLVALGMIVFVSFVYKAQKGKSKKRKKGKVMPLKFKQKTPQQTLFRQELSRYFESTIYVFNTIFGVLLLFGASVAGIIMFWQYQDIVGLFPHDMLFVLLLAFFMFSLGTSVTTNVSISLEGDRLYVKRSLPFSYADIMFAKWKMNMVVVLPFVLLSWALLLPILIVLQMAWYYIVALVLLTVFYFAVMSLFGLVANLWLPKMQFNSDTEVVKQSMSVLITIMTTFALVAVLASIYFTQTLSGYWYGLMLFGLMFALGVFSYKYLQTRGRKIFEEL